MNCIIWGGSGQAKVVRPILEASGEHRTVALFDNDPACVSPFTDVPLLGGWDAFEQFRTTLNGKCGFVVAIGGEYRGEDRWQLALRLIEAGLTPVRVRHPTAWVAEDAKVGDGGQILAMAVIAVAAKLGEQCIVNTGACVDHDGRVGRGVHLMPSATLAGEVTVGDFATIGANATILPHRRVGERAVVGAGAVVTRDVDPDATVIGVPARAVSRHR